jgi:hypothetical protein
MGSSCTAVRRIDAIIHFLTAAMLQLEHVLVLMCARLRLSGSYVLFASVAEVLTRMRSVVALGAFTTSAGVILDII